MDGVNISPVSASAIEQTVNEDILLNVSLGDMSIDRSRETCSGFWDNEYNELYSGDIQVIAKYLRMRLLNADDNEQTFSALRAIKNGCYYTERQ